MNDDVLRRIIEAHPLVIPHLAGRAAEVAKSLAIKADAPAAADYPTIRSTYVDQVSGFVLDYLESDRPVTSFRGGMQNDITVAFQAAIEAGFVDGGGELPLDDVTQSWVYGMIDAEQLFADAMFDHLRDDAITDYRSEAEDRAAGYAQTLDQIYAYGQLAGARNIMLTCVGNDGKESCTDCQDRKGQRHRASWWIANGYPPSRDFECGGYNCEHYLVDDQGNQWTGSEG